MGKYNFNYERLRKIEEENKALSEQISILTGKILSLEKNNQVDVPNKEPPRTLLPFIDDEVANYLFGWDADPTTGEIVPASKEKRNNNFTNFYRYISQTFKPVSNIRTGQKNKYLLRWPQLTDFSENEWCVFKSLILNIVQMVYDAKILVNSSKESSNEKIRNVQENNH